MRISWLRCSPPAGFCDMSNRTAHLQLPLRLYFDDYWQAFLGPGRRCRRIPGPPAREPQARLRAEVTTELAAHRDGDAYTVESTVLIASARR